MTTPAVAKKTPKPRFDCAKCPGYCCSYELIPVNNRDLARLGRHFGITAAAAERRFTKTVDDERAMRTRKDHIYKATCTFFDQEARHCTIYEARPQICRTYPSGPRCGYYEFVQFERAQHNDDTFVP